jgi:two-component system chemotaxis sensor kinase CheA
VPLNLDAALQTFIAEARELLHDMEQALLVLEAQPEDDSQLAAIFRAAHTIKGSAGLFGLDPIVAFAHVVEDLLDRLRAGKLSASREMVALLLACNDHLSELVEVVAVLNATPDANVLEREHSLRKRLAGFGAAAAVNAPALSPEPGAATEAGTWHISVRFGPDTFRNGMDPLSFLRYLDTLGERLGTEVYQPSMDLASLDPESCYLGLEIALRTERDETAIAETFEFIRDECRLRIFPPHTPSSEYRQWLAGLGDEAAWVEGALLRCKTLTALPDAPPAAARVTTEITEPVAVVPKASPEPRAGGYIRVRADKLEELINLAGELLTAGAGAQLLARQCGDEQLIEANSEVSALLEALLDGALAMRMVPIGETFSRFQRVVRDVSQELGKEIELIVSGGDTELDKALIEKIGDPLMHLLRNAMDHGIEQPSVRLAAGKPARGCLRLNAFHDAGNIVLELADDGAGLNRDRILQKARERGLLGATEPTERELYALIFEPGFSTAEAVTNLSGRGVGMDVVKRNITSLRGSIELHSEPGQGTRVRIRLPLTLAMIDGLLIDSAGSAYVVPLDVVQECIELPTANRALWREQGHVALRGEVLPLVFLRDYLGLHAEPAKRENIVVVKAHGLKAGLVVDRLMGEYQTVIKPLGPLFASVQGISGSTVLGSGAVALILDVPALLKNLIDQASHGAGQADHSPIIRQAV